MGLTGFMIIHVFIASFSPAQGERNQIVDAKFTRPVNVMPMSTLYMLNSALALRQTYMAQSSFPRDDRTHCRAGGDSIAPPHLVRSISFLIHLCAEIARSSRLGVDSCDSP